MPTDTQIKLDLEEHLLENGLRLIMNRSNSSPIISFQVWYHVGSIDEKAGITGISHLFEHMMFKGSENIGPEEHSRIVHQHGGTDNAFTSKDCTAYFENLPSSQLELAARLEADRMTNLRLTANTLTSEREVVKEERRLRIDNSLFGRLNEELYATAFVEHPYRWPVIGWMSDLETLCLDDCKSFYRTYYSPNNATILVIGDIDCKRTISIIEKNFSSLQPATIFEEAISPEPQQVEERQREIAVDAQFPWYAVAYHIPDAAHEDIQVLELLGNILTVGRSSRLYQKIICKEKAALSIFSSVDKNRDPGIFSITVGNIRPGHTPESIDTIIAEFLDILKVGVVTEQELEKARNKIETGLVFGLQTNFVRGLRIGLCLERTGEPLGFMKDLDRYHRVSAEDVQRVAKRYFTAENRTVVRLLPKG
ncbi:MAG: insulinase family protein [Candidatus Scalindua sp. AMX11]|nr:MAG: insulinase family protein [Candidatus Scalindua sp.]NOG85386.1 insulinase family protein [Planctomycetota bacterium]RZV83984.1 MAG: insulinase family protein [Candidatus Scalindua sp. SCAELEC01]TDE65731.1 MAG: insulinase family protein [Candidatus Scalindua sp. AMX11]GJQ59664.1 MAG: peptidase M16 [Candidatus Scalindua sp.]